MTAKILHFRHYATTLICIAITTIVGCGSKSDDSSQPVNQPTVNPRDTISFATARQDFDQKLSDIAQNTVEFQIREGFTAYELGAFLQDGALQGTIELDNAQIKSYEFENVNYTFELDERASSEKDADTSLKIIPGFSFSLGAGSNNESVKTINYVVSLSDIRLSQISNPVNAILSGGTDTSAANEFIYGVYTANISYGISFYDEYAKSVTLESGFETELFSADANVRKSNKSEIASEYKFESVNPVTIGFLKRDIASINRIPTALNLSLNTDNSNLIHLTWNAVQDASYYNIFQSETAGINPQSPSTFAQKITIDETSYTFEGQPNQTYYFRLSSTVNRQESEGSLEQGIHTVAGNETPPEDPPGDGDSNSTQPELEPNNDIASAQEVNIGVISGQRSTDRDYDDYFKLIPTKGTLDLKLLHEKQYSATSDYDVYIYNAAEEMMFSFPAHNGEDQQHLIGVEKNKPVYIQMDIDRDTTINDRYKLQLGALDYNYEIEPNNTLASAQTLISGVSVNGGRSFYRDYNDYYYLNTTTNTLRVTLSHLKPLDASSDYTIYVYNVSEDLINKYEAENGIDIDFSVGVEPNSRVYIRIAVDGDNEQDSYYSLTANFE